LITITAELISRAREASCGTGEPALTVLQRLTGLDEEGFLNALSEAFSYPVLDMAGLRELEPAFDLLPFPLAFAKECALGKDAQGHYRFIFTDPLNSGLLEWASEAIRQPYLTTLALRGDLQAWLHQLEAGLKAMDGMNKGGTNPTSMERGEKLSLQSIGADASPIVRLVHSTIYDALMVGASDIHLENQAQGLTIQYRIDGVLHHIAQPAGREVAEQVISRVKVMAELDISERRIPQDGRIRVVFQDREVDIRVSIMPGVFGEDAVLRLLDRKRLEQALSGITLEGLGFEGAELAGIRELVREPYGMFLVTGPTGSGKTTTLYAAVSEIHTGQDKIITIEDPVEYQLPGILQIPVNEKKGLTFARGLRSILRHDPDKILVGEIRDQETAQIAIQSALTGHLVFTTVHANNVFDVISRFQHMGIDPHGFVSALNGVLAQRLVRVNCPHCTVATVPSPSLLARSRFQNQEQYDFKAGKGCAQCRGSGYKGRRAIAEWMRLDDEMRELIGTQAPPRKLKEAATRAGVRTLREAALDLVRRGLTTLEEANRVTTVG
jgi:general secretion pathway protein E